MADHPIPLRPPASSRSPSLPGGIPPDGVVPAVGTTVHSHTHAKKLVRKMTVDEERAGDYFV